ncbi:MAG: universal stress protein [Solirubrobacteraceae bacterium]|nr:universal stress protein [Solirubrobacteraceae bacterium]MCU0312740.1 universal stress protein [Solirubrobacteraceae bacterium]
MISTVAVGTDGSSTADRAVDAAIDLAAAAGARLLVFGAYGAAPAPPADADGPEEPWATDAAGQAQAALEAAAGRARERGVDVTTAADEGAPAEVLVRLAGEHGADVLVVGNRGVGAAYFLDSVAKSVVAKAPCDIWVVKTT